jgi:pimeloyl-ACP methyl ester carboxylesterase
VKPIVIIAAFLASFATAQAHDLTGSWQGSITGRRVVRIIGTSEKYRGEMFLLGDVDGTLNGNPLSSISLQSHHVHFQTDRRFGIFDGEMSADGNSIAGTWRSTYATRPLTLKRATPKTAWTIDPSPHKTRFVTVDRGVALEVLDWGGSGPPLILLGGLGSTAHDFDSMAPKFVGQHHVYGITRRGFGLSSVPPPTEENYSPDRLADDVLTVMAALKIAQPVVAGHSIAGQELSAIAARHPEKVAGLVYLESGYDYAFLHAAPETDAARWDGLDVVLPIVRRDLAALPTAAPDEAKRIVAEIQHLLPRLQNGLKSYTAWPQPPVRMPEQRVRDAILAGAKAYSGTHLPILAIYAIPKKCDPDCDTPAQMAADDAHIKAFAKGNPNARIVRWAHAEHNIQRTREADVVREMNSFMDKLSK